VNFVEIIFQRVPTWNILSDWNIQLIVQKALESADRPLPVSDGVRRVFSLLAAGVISEGKESRDVSDFFFEIF